MSRSISRRSVVRAGIAAPVAALLAPAVVDASPVAGRSGTRHDTHRELRALERRHGATLGVYAANARTGATIAYRAADRFAMCSTFKPLAAAAILRDRDRNGRFLERVIRYTEDDLVTYSPITEQHVDTGMRVRDLCAAAICYSDNTAGNLLLRQIGGPRGVTRFCRSIGDPVTRLDRWETELNSAIPGDPRDTTTPAAIGRDYRRLVLGRALCRPDRAHLTGWLKANTTSANRFGAGLPAGWDFGDKTGSGDYGSANDIGVAWTTRGTPIVLAVMTRQRAQDAPWNDALIAETARLLAHTLAPGE